jgi:hypothetical protein
MTDRPARITQAELQRAARKEAAAASADLRQLYDAKATREAAAPRIIPSLSATPDEARHSTDDEPITLAAASRLYPNAKLTVSTLRAEATRGRLEMHKSIIGATARDAKRREVGGGMIKRQLTAADLAREYGYTPRHWTRLAAAGKVPGARQLSGPKGKWLFDAAVFQEWWHSCERRVGQWQVCSVEAKPIGPVPSVITERSGAASRQRTEKLLNAVLGSGSTS